MKKTARIPPLEHGDHLTQEEFHRRYEAMPHLKKAELIGGMVYLPSPISACKNGVPPLNNGDTLTVAEFERRYNAMPDLKKAELIEGMVYMPSPVRFKQHGKPHAIFNGWLFVYIAHTPGVEAGDNVTMRVKLGEARPQPDACLRIVESCGGRSTIDADGFLSGGPELIGEIAATSATYDLHEKLRVYQENGVLEYVVWRVEDEAIDWFQLKSGKYRRLAKTRDGVYKSKVFPGLWLDPKAMIANDLARVIEVVQQGVAAPEHGKFLAKLAHKTRR